MVLPVLGLPRPAQPLSSFPRTRVPAGSAVPSLSRLAPARASPALPRSGLSSSRGAFLARTPSPRVSSSASLTPPLPAGLYGAGPAPRRSSPSAMAGEAASAAAADVAPSKQVEHLVLFKVRPGEDEAAAAMVTALSDLARLPGIQHLHVGPRLQQPITSHSPNPTTDCAWTHALYGRYDSKAALQLYSDHPDHVSVVSTQVKPIVSEVLAMDWEIEEGGPTGPDMDARVVRFYALEVSDEDAEAALGVKLEKVQELQASLGGLVVGGSTTREQPLVRWISAGKNFAPARAKGHTWGMLVAFSDESAVERFASDSEQRRVVEEGLVGKAKKVAAIDFRPQSRL